MTIARQDAWTHDEDLLLAEVVLRHMTGRQYTIKGV